MSEKDDILDDPKWFGLYCGVSDALEYTIKERDALRKQLEIAVEALRLLYKLDYKITWRDCRPGY